jgi:hypothetical protein
MNVAISSISEAAYLYLNKYSLTDYCDGKWIFDLSVEEADKIKKQLINKQLLVEPLAYLEAVRHIKGFSRR